MGLFSRIGGFLSNVEHKVVGFVRKEAPVLGLTAAALAIPAAFGVVAAAPLEIAGLAGALAIRGAIKAGSSFLKKSTPVVTNAASNFGKEFVKNPIKTTATKLVLPTVGASLLAGAIYEKPSVLTEIPKKSFQEGRKISGFVSEHPIISAGVGAAGLTGAALIGSSLVGGAIDYFKGDKNMPSIPSSNLVSPVPITPETQIVGREAGTSKRVTRYSKRNNLQTQNRQSLRVNIINANQSRIGGRYLNKRISY